MNGGTTFHFLSASPAQALAQARQAAAGADIRIGGGPSTIREFLAADLIDYLHIVVVPIVLGRGGRLWDGLEALEDHFQIEAVNSPSGVTHVILSRR
jgi:dihydrofolate reductase